MGRAFLATVLVCIALIAAPELYLRPAAAGEPAPVPRRAAPVAPRTDLAAQLHVGMPLLTALSRLRETATAGSVQIAAAEVLPAGFAVRTLPERTVRLTATGAAGDLLRYAEAISTSPLPVRVESVELCEVSTARTPLLRLDLKFLSGPAD